MFMMVGHVGKRTVKKSCKYGEYGLFGQSCSFSVLLILKVIVIWQEGGGGGGGGLNH